MAGRVPILQSLSMLLSTQNGGSVKSALMAKNGITKPVTEKKVSNWGRDPTVNEKLKLAKSSSKTSHHSGKITNEEQKKNGTCELPETTGLRKSRRTNSVPHSSKSQSVNDIKSEKTKNDVAMTKKKSPAKCSPKRAARRRKKSQSTSEKTPDTIPIQRSQPASLGLSVSPSKLRLSSLIDKLSQRTSQNHDTGLRSPKKRLGRNSLFFEEPLSKKIKTDIDEEFPEEFEAVDSGELEPPCSIEVLESVDMSDTQRSMTLAVGEILNLEQEIALLTRRYTVNKIPLTDDSVRIYSGLPNLQIFDAVYDKIKPMVLKIRCRKGGRSASRVRRKYRRLSGEFVGVRRLNLKDEFMIAMIHARGKADIRDTSKRYGISVGQCRNIVRIWETFLQHELHRALISLQYLLPKSKWTTVPEYTPSSERDTTPCSDTSFESTGTDSSSSKWGISPRRNGLGLDSLIPRRTQNIPKKSGDCKELRKLITTSIPTDDHEGFFDFKSNYICEYCFSFHDSSLELLEHTKSRFGPEYEKLRSQLEALVTMIKNNSRDAQEWKCCVCIETRDTLSSFLTHLNLHLREPSSTCLTCNRYFPTKEQHDIHIRSFHEKKKTYFCELCCIVFESERELIVHQLKHSKPKEVPAPAEVTFFQHKNPKIAIPRLAPVVKTITKRPRGRILAAKGTTGKRKRVKRIEPKTVLVQRTLLPKDGEEPNKPAANSTNDGTPPKLKCELCVKSFCSLANLEQHKYIHADKSSEDRIQCPHCPRTFAHRVTLKVHMTQHTGEKPHKCQYCEKSFFRKNDLYNHERIHTGEKPYSCQYCGAKFAHSCSLAAHVRQSCSMIPSKCEICGYICEQRNEFESHMKTHVSEAKYRCNICGKTFLMRHHLEQHRNIHLKKFPCNSCNALFHSQSELETHASTHSNVVVVSNNSRGPNKCELCSKCFTRRSDLKRHRRRIHHIFETSPKSEDKKLLDSGVENGSGSDAVDERGEVDDSLGIDPLVIVE